MAEVAYRLRTIDQNLRVADLRALRLQRKATRGLMVNTSTGFSTRDRRNFLNLAVAGAATGATVPILRERYQRKGWALQDAITTAQG